MNDELVNNLSSCVIRDDTGDSLPTGAFKTEYARRRCNTHQWRIDRPLAAALGDWSVGRTVLDFGAGMGAYCRELSCRGIDGIPGIAELSGGIVEEGDLADPALTLPDHDAAICLEVAEHLPRHYEATFLRHLTSQCEILALSWAKPDQPGVGHVNCRTADEIIALLERQGFLVDEPASRFLKEAATISWFRENILAFRRRVAKG